ncbi:MAG: DUF4278 domain-containing protein [Kovacikia sp.]
MELVYRGVSYDYTPSHPQFSEPVQNAKHETRSSYKLSYRGAVYSVNPNVEPQRSLFHVFANLIYRGVAYSLNG